VKSPFSPFCQVELVFRTILFAVFFVFMFHTNLPFLTGQSQSSTGTSSSAQGTIRGKVTDENGTGLAGAAIEILAAGSALGVAKRIESNSEGSFSIENLPPGAYRLLASTPAYVMSGPPMNEEGEEPYYYPGEQVNLRMIKGGVITGTITDANGEPAAGAAVRLARKGRSSWEAARRPGMSTTDDRGIYRIYGLTSGNYLVQAGGSDFSGLLNSPYQLEASAFYSIDSSGAPAEVAVRTGEEARNIDIRLKGLTGHLIRGEVNPPQGVIKGATFTSVHLFQEENEAVVAVTLAIPKEDGMVFSLGSIPDGRYLILAGSGFMEENPAISAVMPLTVKGSDLTGISLQLKALGSFSGIVSLEPAKAPPTSEFRSPDLAKTIKEIALLAQPLGEKKRDRIPDAMFLPLAEGVPRPDGTFQLKNLTAGRYWLKIQLPADSLYIQAIQRTNAGPGTNIQDLATGFALLQGENQTGNSVKLGVGAAQISGRVVPAKTGEPLPEKIVVFLVPSDADAADNVFHYASIRADHDRRLKLSHIPPGNYWLLPLEEDSRNQSQVNSPPIFFNPASRKKLRQLAAQKGILLSLPRDCRIDQFEIPFSAP
jgi:hypothetical protein